MDTSISYSASVFINGLAKAVIVYPQNVCLFVFFFLQLFVSKHHQIFQDHSESLDEHRTSSNFFRFAPRFDNWGGGRFLIF